MTDIAEYEELVRESGAFRDIELSILKESLISWEDSPGDPFILLELRDGKILAGFVLAAAMQNTEHSFTIDCIGIDGVYREMGVLERLIAMTEKELLASSPEAILRIELSQAKKNAIGAECLPSLGYTLIGHIPDFYGKGDDFFIYAKHIERPITEAALKTQASAEPKIEAERGVEGEGPASEVEAKSGGGA